VRKNIRAGKPIRGAEVDDVSRGAITRAGFGEQFTHRTGHSIGEETHGNGVNIDDFETRDSRRIIPGVCFSIEPGIYFEGKFGVRSAMPAITAERLCPNAVFLPPDFSRYRAVSRSVREIFLRHTHLVEPLSLDEAYLDVTQNKTGISSATQVARTIREQIRLETNLSASAGVAANKFLAKIASDWRKPDGLFVIKPSDAVEFLTPLPVERLPGVGKVTTQRLIALGVSTVGDLRTFDATVLENHFGRFGIRLYELARGIDNNAVEPNRPTQSISAEDTFESDVLLNETEAMIRQLAEKVWLTSSKESKTARTIVLKLKTAEFNILTRSHTPATPISSCEELISIALRLRERVQLGRNQKFRLVGIGLSNFRDAVVESTNDLLFG